MPPIDDQNTNQNTQDTPTTGTTPPVPTTDTQTVPNPIPDTPPMPAVEEMPSFVSNDSQTPPPPPMPQTEESQGTAAPNFDIPPVISPVEKPKGKVSGKTIATILGILFLVVGVTTGVILVKQQQDIRSKACGPGTITTPYGCAPAPSTNTGSSGGSIGVAGAGGANAPGGGTSNISNNQGEPIAVVVDNSGTITESNDEGGSIEVAGAGGANAPGGGTSNILDSSGEPVTVKTDASGQIIDSTSLNNYLSSKEYYGSPCDTETPGVRVGDPGYCGWDECGVGVCANGCTCPTGTTCTGREIAPGSTFAAKECESGGVAVPVNTAILAEYESTNPPTTATYQCLKIEAYDNSWNKLTTDQLKALKKDDIVRFTVEGSASTGSFDGAKFTINGVVRPEVTTTKPGSTTIFYDEYTIPDGITQFTINAQVHHTTAGWM